MTNIIMAFMIPITLAIIALIWLIYMERKFKQEKNRKK